MLNCIDIIKQANEAWKEAVGASFLSEMTIIDLCTEVCKSYKVHGHVVKDAPCVWKVQFSFRGQTFWVTRGEYWLMGWDESTWVCSGEFQNAGDYTGVGIEEFLLSTLSATLVEAEKHVLANFSRFEQVNDWLMEASILDYCENMTQMKLKENKPGRHAYGI